MSLDDAFRKVHSEFGIFGFSDLAESYTKSIEKRYRRFFWEEFVEFFTSYRIIYPAGIGFILYWLSVNTRPFGYEITLPIWAAVFFLAGLIYIAIKYLTVRNGLKNYVAYKSTNNFLAILNLFMQVNFYGLRYFENPGFVIDFTAKGVIMALGLLLIAISYLSIFLLPRVLDRSIEETRKLQVIYEG